MTAELCKTLINLASVTPEDAGCQALIAERLAKCGFSSTNLRYEDVDNLWLTHGEGGPLFCFLGHTDVVPPGPRQDWSSDPFVAEERDGYLYGRGAADMKGSVAAMVHAFERFLDVHPQHSGTLAMLLTSDEEGDAINGTVRVMDYLQEQGVKINWCLVGEPSSREQLGDVVKIGRRGSLGARLVVKGIQGHVAYPDAALNPLHKLAPALNELCAKQWDQGNQHYPPTSFQVSNIHAGTGAVNVIPGELEMLFNFRFSTELSDNDLMEQTETILDRHGLDYEIKWRTSGQPSLTSSGELIGAVSSAISASTGLETELSTSGGTSDGRFVAPSGAEVVELGPVNATIHKTDECVKLSDLETLAEIYYKVLTNLFPHDTA